ncbi:MAG: hypothetical protein WCY09_00100 [Candidatus Omnitrophota bacterium]
MIKPKKTLHKRFIAAESDTLVIETIQTESLTNHQSLRILKLKGTWHANEYNELVFEAILRKGPPENYTFKGSWKLNDNQQIEYASVDGLDTLTFKGYWQLRSEDRLVYIFEGNSDSRFEFKVQLESSTLYPKKGQIRYRIGVGMRQNRLKSAAQVIILYGEWKFGRNLGLSFQMDYGQGVIKSIEFQAVVTFGRNKVIFALKDEVGKPLGITLTMTYKFLKSSDAEVFIRLKSRRNQQSIEAGISIPF